MRIHKRTLQQMQSEIASAYYLAEGRLNSQQLNANVREVIARAHSRTDTGQRRYPVSYASNLTGYADALHAMLWRDKVGFAYRDKEGVIYWTTKAKQTPTGARTVEEFYGNGRAYLLNDMQSAHLWLCNGKEFTRWSLIGKGV